MGKFLLRILGISFLFLSLTFVMPAAGYAGTFSRTNVPAQIQVTVSSSNVRSGPATSFKVVGLVYRGAKIQCIGKLINNNLTWWVVHLPDDTVGAICGSNAKPYYPPSPAPSPTPAQVPSPQPAPTEVKLTAAQQQMLDLLNARRAKAGVGPLRIDSTLQKVAQARSDKIVSTNTFSHQLPDLGSPFDTMKTFGVTYTSAGENIAGNQSVQAAETALENDPPHLENIINGSFNCVGIGITTSSQYGYVFVQDFIGR